MKRGEETGGVSRGRNSLFEIPQQLVIMIDAICIYDDGYHNKDCGISRLGPLFAEALTYSPVVFSLPVDCATIQALLTLGLIGFLGFSVSRLGLSGFSRTFCYLSSGKYSK
jgi:hypothetical protein